MTDDPKRDLQRESEAAAHLRTALGDVIEHDDDEAWGHALEGQTDFYETLTRMMDAVAQDLADIDALKRRIGQMQSRKTRLETRVERAKDAIRHALHQAQLPRARTDLGTISFAPNQRVDIVNSERLPDWAWRHPPPTPDKEQIGKRLKAGEDVPGAELVRTEGLRITWT